MDSETPVVDEQAGESQSPEVEPPKRRISVPIAVILASLLGLAILTVWGVRTVLDAIPSPGEIADVFEPEPYEEIGPVTITAIRDLAQLTTVESVQYTIVEKGTDAGWLQWARGDSLRMFVVARIGAGVDLGQLTTRDISVDENGVVEITLPGAIIQFVDPDEGATQVLSRETGIFTSGDPGLESDVRRIADEVLQENAVDEGILDRAETNARDVLTDFLISLGYSDVIVEFTERGSTS